MKLRVYELALETMPLVAALITRIERHDRDLARQLRRASVSVPLNIAEGSHSKGGNRRERFTNAMSSARESIACLQVAEAMSRLPKGDAAEVVDRLDHVVAMLWRLRRK